MPLRIYKNKITGEEKRTLKTLPESEWEQVISAPNQKFMISADPDSGKSKLKDQERILTARSRNYSRDKEIDDTIQVNLDNGLTEAVAKNLLNNKGERRKKVDDL